MKKSCYCCQHESVCKYREAVKSLLESFPRPPVKRDLEVLAGFASNNCGDNFKQKDDDVQDQRATEDIPKSR